MQCGKPQILENRGIPHPLMLRSTARRRRSHVAKLDDATLAKRLRDQLQQCAGWEEDAIAADRRRALDDYFQRPNGTEVSGRAQVVSGDLSAMVESNLASITEALSDDELIEIKADSAEDVEQAQLEADALVHFVMHQSAGRYHL